ncbi:NRT1/ PTR family 1.2-like protein [Tanacetum coccineum]
MSVALGANVLLIWSAATNFLPIVGAFLSDSLLGRFLTIFFWLYLQSHGDDPSMVNNAFALMSIGAGGIRPCSLAFGADQIDCKDNPKRERLLESFFGWYYASALMGVLIAFTGIVYIQDHHGWRVGFGIPVVLMLISTLSFIVAYPLYYKMKVEKSLFTSLCQLVLAAWKNRKATLPDSSEGSWYYRNDTKVATPTKNLR